MQNIFDSINSMFQFLGPVSDFLWGFPTNMSWYAAIPILGKLSLAIILLVGAGIYITVRTNFVQVRHFRRGLGILMRKKTISTGISPFASFMLSTAMRVGAGNIIAVTGAITAGGPGALFWMWVSAFFGMASTYVESTLAQLFKEKKGDEFVGGMAFYGRKLFGGNKAVGYFLSGVLLIFAVFCLPLTTFHMFASIGGMATQITHRVYESQSTLNYIIAIAVILCTVVIVFGGIKKVTRFTDKVVPVMALIYAAIVLVIVILNLDKIPYFFMAVLGGAFKPEAIFGGTFGTVFAIGVKRGLMTNEAGQGTVTMFAASADNDHPCEQGCAQAIGVFLDTMVVCSLSGFVIVLAHLWTGDAGVAWDAVKGAGIQAFIESVSYLVPGSVSGSIVRFIIYLCYALFAYTTMLGMISFAEIASNGISRNNKFILGVRIACTLIFIPFGTLTVLAGLNLDNLWTLADVLNIICVFFNVPVLLIGFKYVKKAIDNFQTGEGTITSEMLGIDVPYWDEKAKAAKARGNVSR